MGFEETRWRQKVEKVDAVIPSSVSLCAWGMMILNRVSREIDTAEGCPGMELVVHLLNLLSCFMFTEQSRT